MSFVVFAGCQYFGIMFGDRRCSDKEGNVLSDNAQKVRRINDKLIIGGSGDEALINVLWKNIFMYQPIKELSYDICIELIINKFHALLPEIKRLQLQGHNFQANIGVTSNWNNIIEFTSIDILNDTINVKKM